MDANRPGKSSAPRVFLFRLLLILLLLTAALGALVWRAPTWVGAKLTRFRLYAEGFRSHTALLNGHHVFYIEGGPAGAANVVLIHGLGTEAEEDWVVLAPCLVRAGYHVYAMDLLGYGRSDKPTEMSYSISEEARFVESFLEANRLTSVSLAGVSMGGWIAAAVALDKPQLISRLNVVRQRRHGVPPEFRPSHLHAADRCAGGSTHGRGHAQCSALARFREGRLHSPEQSG